MNGLFDAGPYRAAPALPDLDGLSADRRRTIRQAAAIARGLHPLSLVAAGLRLHADADQNASRDDRGPLPLRCGSCTFRADVGRFPKCTRLPALVARSAATDVRAWWPACQYYEPIKEG